MTLKIEMDWLALYICVGISGYLGYENYPLYLLIVVAFFLLIVQIITIPTCAYSKSGGFYDTAIIRTYSLKDLVEQYLVDMVTVAVIYFLLYGINYLLNYLSII
jgi:hypothetical protein